MKRVLRLKKQNLKIERLYAFNINLKFKHKF